MGSSLKSKDSLIFGRFFFFGGGGGGGIVVATSHELKKS